jgi:hypothetical protein
MPITFYWKLSYQGEVEYEVYGDGNKYTVRLRREADPYIRTLLNDDADGTRFQQEYVQAVGILRAPHSREHNNTHGLISPEILEAFNAYQRDKHAAELAEILKMRLKWNPSDTEADVLRDHPYPPDAVAGYYESGRGWVRAEALAEVSQ